MIINVDLKKKQQIRKHLVESLGWKEKFYPNSNWSSGEFISPTRANVTFGWNSFYQYNKQHANVENIFRFKLSELQSITVDTDKKLLIFGDNLAAVDVS